MLLSPLARYGLVALAMTVMVISSPRGSLQARQNPVDCNDPQDEGKAGAQAEDDDKARADFLQVYRLSEGQDLKRIEPPRPRGAEVWWQRNFGKNAGSGTEGYGAMVFRFRDPDQLTNSGGLFGPPTGGYPIRNLPEAIGMDVDPAEIEGDAKILKTAVTGDWIFREDVPAERTVGLLESILQRSLRQRIKLTFRQVARDVVVARGRYRYVPLPRRSKNQIDLYGKQLVITDQEFSRTGEFPRFLKEVGQFIGRPIVNEVELPAKEPVSWFTHVRSPFTKQMHREDHDEELVLKHLHEQTELTFSREMKPIRIFFVERPE